MESSDTTETMVSIGNNIEKPADLPVSNEKQERCQSCREMKDPKTKFGTFIFSLIMMVAGAILLYFGFEAETRADSGGKGNGEISRDNKIVLTSGFICALLGVFSFVISILMFKNADCLYDEDSSKEDEEFSPSRSSSKK